MSGNIKKERALLAEKKKSRVDVVLMATGKNTDTFLSHHKLVNTFHNVSECWTVIFY